MPIWFKKDLSIEDLQPLNKGTMGEHIGIVYTEVGEDYIKGTMPVDHRTIQPYGLLHGGASVALAETLGSVAAAMVVDHSKYYCVGLEINANHIRSAKEGLVTGVAKAIHLGRKTQVWEIRITDEKDKLVCLSRHTVAVLPRD